MRWLFIMLFTLVCASAQAEEVVLGLSQDRVQITATFDGDEILIFGAVKRETPIPEGDPLQVIITVAGPSESLTVYRKARALAYGSIPIPSKSIARRPFTLWPPALGGTW